MKRLVISHIHPLHPKTGQTSRLRKLLEQWKAAGDSTTIALLNFSGAPIESLHQLVNKVIELPTQLHAGHKIAAKVSQLWGQKPINYHLNAVLLHPNQVMGKLGDLEQYDAIVFEYYYAFELAKALRKRGLFVICDMHNILWKSYAQGLESNSYLPKFIKQLAVQRYRRREEKAWHIFDALWAITHQELEEVAKLPALTNRVSWQPYTVNCEEIETLEKQKALVFFGGLRMAQNQEAALFFAEQLQPQFLKLRGSNWNFWIVGSNPPTWLKARLEASGAVVFENHPQPEQIIGKAALAVIPFSGNFGFRTRVPEIVCMGTPVLTSGEGFDLRDVSPEQAKKISLINGWEVKQWIQKIDFCIQSHCPKFVHLENQIL